MRIQQHITFHQTYPVTLFSGLLLSGGSTYVKGWRSITIVTEGGYESWNLTFPEEKLSGFEPELMANLCQRMQIGCKLVIQSQDGMITGLDAEKYNVIMNAIAVAPEWSEIVAFTQVYATAPASLITVKGSLLLPSPTVKLHDDKKETQVAITPLRTALEGKTIGITSGAVYIPFIDKYFKDIADIREYNDSADAILDLQAEHIDAVFDNITFANTTLSRPENNNLALNGLLMSGPI